MTLRGLLNSEEFLELNDDVRVVVDEVDVMMSTRPPNVSLVAVEGDRELWRTVLPDFAPDITSAEVDNHTVDYRAAGWESGQLLVVAGEDRAYLIGYVDGRVKRELPLGATGISTVDFVGIVELRHGSLLAVASAKVVWLVNGQAEIVGEFRYQGPVDSVRAGQPNELVVAFYDVENASWPVVDHVINLDDLGGAARA
ncbi:hypothetical protein Lesp02_49450 [Lentzea sp. NBRC 105346]|uniref:hypothetical protein n=1 Tax=Lentzea sp. NBRC 105346 TaxID=3032205 RepID=UPI0024A3D108|nr:hypothetical protein [Lentzea sp. NBRC 105346]GLZ32757.1 hypothetical protein Lesp02_49450 [Lentzea sp. NBRC 105346]